jgi:hypothetical protein
MTVRLSVLARGGAEDPSGAFGRLAVPALLLRGPLSNIGETWDRTGTISAKQTAATDDPLVLLVTKAVGGSNPFAMGVTIGRVATNDIAIDDASISRFHAYLQHDERQGIWTLVDADSRNGTFLNGVRLEQKQRLVVPDGALIGFGRVVVTFVLPASLRQMVEAERARR